MNSLYVYAALLVLAIFAVACSQGEAQTIQPDNLTLDEVVCREVVDTYFGMLGDLGLTNWYGFYVEEGNAASELDIVLAAYDCKR